MLWKLAERVLGHGAEAEWIPVAISLLVGGAVFITLAGDSQVRPKSLSQWVVAVVVGVINSLYLATSALGLLK